MTLNLSKLLSKKVLGKKYLGKTVDQSRFDAVFIAGACPDNLSYTKCIKKGDRLRYYHLQAWVSERICPYCKFDHFTKLESYVIKKSTLAAVICSNCQKVIECYKRINL